MSDIGVPNESALSYKKSHNPKQTCAKLRTLPFNGHFTPSQVVQFSGQTAITSAQLEVLLWENADADIPGFPATCKRENVAV